MRVSSKSGTSSVGTTRAVGSAGSVGQTSATTQAQGVSDAMAVSSTAQFLAVARAHLAKVPDIRRAKVEAIRMKLADNTYNPDGEAVADGLVREHSPTHRSR